MTTVTKTKKEINNKWNEFWKQFLYFIKNTILLFKQNFFEVVAFTFFCAIFTVIASDLLKNSILRLMMMSGGTTYISPINLKQVFLNPMSIILFFVLLICITFLSLFEIAGLQHAFAMGQVGRDTNLSSMFAAGIRTCKKALNPKNWFLIVFIVVLFPLTEFLPLSSSTVKLILPGFITQAIDYTTLYFIIYQIVYFILLCFIVVYIFGINIFILQKSNFIKSCDRSRRLGKGHYANIFLTMLLLTLLMNIIINSVSSATIMNIREFIALFQKNIGVVSRSSQMGTYTYVLRQILKSLISPAVNNAALTVLFFRYIEEKELITALSPDTFVSINPSKKKKIAVALLLILFFLGSGVCYGNKYSFLNEPVQKPSLFGHRGDSANAPENTMPAFELAAKEGIDWIELDVYQTADDVIVVSHDASLERVTGVDLMIREHTYEELKQVEMGDWMPGDYEHVVIPTLEEVLRMAKENGMKVYVELKGHEEDVNYEENVLKVIYDTDMQDDVMVASTDAKRMKRIRELDKNITTGYAMIIALGNVEDIEYIDDISLEESNVTPELVDRLHKQGKKVFCWTVDSEDLVQYLVSCNVDVIGTGNPMLINAALEKADYNGGINRAFHIMMHVIASMDK